MSKFMTFCTIALYIYVKQCLYVQYEVVFVLSSHYGSRSYNVNTILTLNISSKLLQFKHQNVIQLIAIWYFDQIHLKTIV